MAQLATERRINHWRCQPEVQLMLRVKRDDPEAFRELLSLYWPRVFGQFLKQLGDRQEAEDLAQDVFLRLYRNRRRYQPRASFATWLYHIARNVARNAVRSRRRRPVVSLTSLYWPGGDESFEEHFPFNKHEQPVSRIEREETTRAVRSAMSHLAGRQRTALELQFKDHSYSEIADELEMTPKAAKSLLYRARVQLRESLHPFVHAEVS
jgi:RNA polymerase sigma-70 factor (ECF subfamily)